MGQSSSIRQQDTEKVCPQPAAGDRNRQTATASGKNEQAGKSTKARNKYYKSSTKDDVVLRATLEAIIRLA